MGAPARQEAMDKAHTQISSLWDTVRASTSKLATEASQHEAVGNASAKLSNVADTAAAAASTLYAGGASGLFARASRAASNLAQQTSGPASDNEPNRPTGGA